MDKPRPRVTLATSSSIIIESPNLQTRQQRLGSTLFTLIFWLLWLYLLLPLLSLALWLLGFNIVYHQMIILEGYKGLLGLLKWYTLFFGGLCTSLLIWGRINFIRFRNKEKRTKVNSLSTAEVASYFNQNADSLAAWQKCKKMTLHLSKEGHLVKVSDCAN